MEATEKTQLEILSALQSIKLDTLDINVKLQAIFQVQGAQLDEMKEQTVILQNLLAAFLGNTRPGVAVKFVPTVGSPISKGAKK